ncbi:diaminopimelate epimerase [Prochlorococcus marinus]|uniref:Diaminopimelate epimerase n=1 Tax=Prochlorococcus marinus (strain MIT 9211) TaxID=93059 RepID=A9BAE5_PROM4|nr:diaminopimelate epimerase [Prochlorococcus marinus]ABX08807.1 Diaminopimelate epimerase [Prochlorococcus marinus str. MIT 9211]
MTLIGFKKYHGLGNDFIIIDGRFSLLPSSIVSAEKHLVISLCKRHYGIGCDGIILILPPVAGGDFRMKIFNSDGSEPEMCGNGIRCLIRYILDDSEDDFVDSFIVETLAGKIQINIEEGNIKVDMGSPIFAPEKIPTTLPINERGIPQGRITILDQDFLVSACSMGNPHAIIEVPTIKNIPLYEWGQKLETHPVFPKYTNVHFVQVKSRSEIEILIWERGCGPTLACGTGACACLAVLAKLGKCNDLILVKLPGGELEINWPKMKGSIFMIGDAKYVYSGSFNI